MFDDVKLYVMDSLLVDCYKDIANLTGSVSDKIRIALSYLETPAFLGCKPRNNLMNHHVS